MPEWFDASIAVFKTSCSHTRKKLKGKQEEKFQREEFGASRGKNTRYACRCDRFEKKDPFHLFRNVKHYFLLYVLKQTLIYRTSWKHEIEKRTIVYTRLIVAIWLHCVISFNGKRRHALHISHKSGIFMLVAWQISIWISRYQAYFGHRDNSSLKGTFTY